MNVRTAVATVASWRGGGSVLGAAHHHPRDHGGDEQRERDGARSRDGQRVTPDETRQRVPRRIGTRDDGALRAMPPEIVRQRRGAGIAPGRFLAQRLARDRLEIAREAAAQLRDAGRTGCGRRVGDGRAGRRHRLAVGGKSRVVQARDVRVRETGQHVALAREAFREDAARQREQRKLERHWPAQQAVGTLRQPDFAHAATSEHAREAIRPDEAARREVGRRVVRQVIEARQRIDEIARLGACALLEQLGQQRPQRGRLAGQRREPCGGRRLVEVERVIEQFGECAPAHGMELHLASARRATGSRKCAPRRG